MCQQLLPSARLGKKTLRKLQLTCLQAGCLLVVLIALAPSGWSFDWPEHRGNAQRSAFVEQPLSAESWTNAWKSELLAAPDPAWPKPARGSLWQRLTYIAPRVTDDRADVPVIAEDKHGELRILVPSTGNDCLVCLDPQTGAQLWTYLAQAPLRFAPSVRDGIAYGGGDDGLVYAIDISDGQLIWRQRIGPELPWIVGNGRLISPHPVRTSVLVQEDQVIANAGLFPSQGVYTVALSRADGELVWRRRTDRSPQGYLLSGDSRVIVPAGRATPYAIDAATGQMLGDLPAATGTFCMVTPEATFTGPGNSGAVEMRNNADNAQLLSFNGQAVAAGFGNIWTADGQMLKCYTTRDLNGKPTTEETWSIECALNEGLIVSGAEGELTLFVTGGNLLQTVDALTGTLKQSLNIDNEDGPIVYLAVAANKENDCLVATTQSGAVYCWHGSQNKTTPADQWTNAKAATVDDSSEVKDVNVDSIIELLPSDFGLAMVVDDRNGSITRALAETTKLKIASIVRDEDLSRRLRHQFVADGLYGRHVSVWHVPETSDVPFADGLFNLIVQAQSESSISTAQLKQCLAAAGGCLVTIGNENDTYIKPELVGAGSWRHQYATPENRADSQDRIVGQATDFRLQWFGGVGPSRMPDRHLRGPAPLVAGGTMVMHGDGKLIGVDRQTGSNVGNWIFPPQLFGM